MDDKTKIIIDYNVIRSIIERYDHQIILNRDDPMVPCIEQFQAVIKTPGDPTSELLAILLKDMIDEECRLQGADARVGIIRVWESPTCYAEVNNEDH